MRVLPQLLGNEEWGGEAEGRNGWMENPDHRIYRRQHDGFLWILHDFNTGGGPSRRTWSHWWLLICKPDLQREMQPAAKRRAATYSNEVLASALTESHCQPKQSNTLTKHMIDSMKNVCEKKWWWQTHWIWASVFTINKCGWDKTVSPDRTESARLTRGAVQNRASLSKIHFLYFNVSKYRAQTTMRSCYSLLVNDMKWVCMCRHARVE